MGGELVSETQDLGIYVFPKSLLKRSEGRNLRGRELKRIPQGKGTGKGTWNPLLLHPYSPHYSAVGHLVGETP